MKQSQIRKRWYDNKLVTHILLVVFFPLGLFALWKSRTIAKWWKVIATVIIGLIVITNYGESQNANVISSEISGDNSEINNLKKELSQFQKDSAATSMQKEDELRVKIKNDRAQIIVKLKKRAKRDWPNDYSTQEYWINEQIEAYEYMLTIENNSIKKQAQRDWPLDFSTQKYWYNLQIEARERLR